MFFCDYVILCKPIPSIKYNRFFETLEIGEELLGLELRKKFADLSVSFCFIKDEFLESSRISDHFCNFRKDEAF